MEFEPTEYVRRPFNVLAVEISYDNIDDVAKWCGGEVDVETSRINGMSGEVKLPVIKLAGDREDKGKILVARLGYFIVKLKHRFQVYKPTQFKATFEQLQGVDEKGECDNCPDTLDENLTREVEEKTEALHDNLSIGGQETVMVNLGGQNLL